MPGEMALRGPLAPGQGLPEATGGRCQAPGPASRVLLTGTQAAGRSRPWPLSALPPWCLRPQLPRLCAGVPSGQDHLHPPPATYTSRPL